MGIVVYKNDKTVLEFLGDDCLKEWYNFCKSDTSRVIKISKDVDQKELLKFVKKLDIVDIGEQIHSIGNLDELSIDDDTEYEISDIRLVIKIEGEPDKVIVENDKCENIICDLGSDEEVMRIRLENSWAGEGIEGKVCTIKTNNDSESIYFLSIRDEGYDKLIFLKVLNNVITAKELLEYVFDKVYTSHDLWEISSSDYFKKNLLNNLNFEVENELIINNIQNIINLHKELGLDDEGRDRLEEFNNSEFDFDGDMCTLDNYMMSGKISKIEFGSLIKYILEQ